MSAVLNTPRCKLNTAYCSMTDNELLAEAKSERLLCLSPIYRELLWRFAEDVAAVDADFEQALAQPEPLSIDTAPKPIA
jgi:hypothetical protein